MALNTQISVAAQNAMINALAALANGGYLDLYSLAQPAGPATAVTSQVKLARLGLAATAFGAASVGAATANPIAGTSAIATGTATWFRVLASDGVTALWDGAVGTSGANLNLNSVSFVAGAPVTIAGWALTEPAAGA